jgi:hypothetical protein
MKRSIKSAAAVGFGLGLVGVPLAAALMVNTEGRGEGLFNLVLLAEVLVLIVVGLSWRWVREFLACRRAGASVITSAATAAQRTWSSTRQQHH